MDAASSTSLGSKDAANSTSLGSMDVKREALDRFVAFVEANLEGKVFTEGCTAWYRNARGVNWTLWPNDLTSYWWHTYSCDEKDYEFSSA